MQPQAFCRCSIWSLLLFWLLAFPLPASGQEASANRVSLEVVTHPNLTPGVAQDWMRKLESLKLDSLRVRSGTGREKPELRQESGTSKPTFRVIAILTRGNQLLLPDATFRSNELPKLRSYLQKLGTKQDDPPAGSLAPLGLTGEQWDAVREKLRPPVTDSTKGQRVAKVVEQLQQQLGEPLQWELGSETAIDEPFDVPDELQGLSLGTALAAALRPAGLVLVPRPTEGTSLVRLAVARSEDAKQVWPVGWAPDERPGKLVPKLFDFFPAEIENAGLVEVLTAIAGRTGIACVFDHNSIVQKNIDIHQARVTLKPERTYYKKAIDHSLYQAQLTSELRVDDSGRPFLWITPR